MAFMVAMVGVAIIAFTQPIPTERPKEQARLFDQVPRALPGPPPTAASVAYGEALAYMEIPRFGDQWFWAVSEGVDLDTLALGPGHFPDSALPGEEGNTAYAAHRSGHGDPFIDFDKLVPGDTVTLSQSGASWTYEIVARPEIIDPEEDWVVGHLDGHWLTLTTCWPKYGSEKRMYVRARLVSTTS